MTSDRLLGILTILLRQGRASLVHYCRAYGRGPRDRAGARRAL